MNKMTREELIKRLRRLDEDVDLLYDDDREYKMVIVGGSALILLETITRATHDIDVLDVSPDIVFLLEKYDMNTRVASYINNFPYNYDDRLVFLFKGKRVSFYTASLEDIVIAKLYAWRPQDMQDIIDENVVNAVDWDLLEKLATAEDEARASALNDRCYREFQENYKDYVGRYRK